MATFALDHTARLVMMQFSFSNPQVIPNFVRRRQAETKPESEERKQQPSRGIAIIEPVENISVQDFALELEAQGYVLVDGVYQSRQNPHKPMQMYHMVRFTFSRVEHAEISDHFQTVQSIIRTELSDICDGAFWRTRGFSNPFYKSGEEIPGYRAVSLNFEARVPRYLPDGQPVKERRKDAQGRKIGDPVPLEPSHRLIISNGTLTLSV